MFESILSTKATASQHLSADAQRELVRKYQEEGCQKSLTTLVESNLKLVCKVASRYKHARAEADDFLAEGVRGIMKAANKYKLDSDASFSTYAYQWIRHFCGRHLETFVKEPWQQSLSKPLCDEGWTVADMVTDPSDNQEVLYQKFEFIERVQGHIVTFSQGLKEREEFIFQSRTTAEEPKTLQAIADVLGLTKERVRQIENNLLSKFKAYLVKVN